jgi:SAM-dependent methyltransferase
MNKDEQQLLFQLEKEYSHEFKGWDFSYLTKSGRMSSFPLSWNYKSIVEDQLKQTNSLLDMGTGGGEYLSSIIGLPKESFATEGYEPNIPIAKKRLGEIGIEVRKIENDIIPYEDNKFDLVINRHESYLETEIKRVLSENGVFITQQVGGLTNADLNMWMGAKVEDPISWSLCTMVLKLGKEGFNVTRQNECITKTRFFDIGAIIYYLKCIPWQIKDFSIKEYWERIYQLAKYIRTNGYIDFIWHGYLIVAKK